MFKIKFVVDGSVQNHKDRLMAKGYAQQFGVDFEETFSLVAQFKTLRLVLALAAQLQWQFINLMSSRHSSMETYKKKSMSYNPKVSQKKAMKQRCTSF